MGMMQLVMMGAAAALSLALIAVALAMPSPAKVKARRLADLRERHSAGVGVEAQLRKIAAARATRVDDIAMRYLPNPAQLKKRLAMTGRNWTVGQYAQVSLALIAVVSGVCLFKGLPVMLALGIGCFVGTFVPHMVTGTLIKRRVKAFVLKFPDAIELLVRGLRSGLPISETMQVVGKEIEGPVGVEFRSITDRIKIGRSMDAALQDTSDRLGIPEFQFFCITIAIQRETGGNLAETLSNLANVLRQRMQMKLKIKAMSSEAKASAIIVGALPFIVFGLILWLNPGYMGGFFTEPRLMIAGGGGLVWMGIGVFMMAKMVNFEI